MARMVKNGPSIEQIAEEVFQTATSKGWHEGEPRTVSDYVALAVTELGEAMEEHRNGYGFNDVHFTVKLDKDRPSTDDPNALSGLRKIAQYNMSHGDTEMPNDVEWLALVHAGIAKPEGVAVEFIDVVIRCLDTLRKEGTNIQRVLDMKMAYNRTRPHRHGGKLL